MATIVCWSAPFVRMSRRLQASSPREHWTYAIHRPFGDTAGHSFDQPFRAKVSRER